MLPKIQAPTYEITLPVSHKSIKFRPFLVKEQKILLMAMESSDESDIGNNIQQVLRNCLISENVNIDDLPIADIEYYFLNLRARSIGEIVESRYRCNNVVNGKECGNIMDTEINILDIKVEIPEIKDDVIRLTDKIGVKMKYPNFDLVKKLKNVESVADVSFELIINCIEYVFDDENLYYAHETPKEELLSFLESLTKDQFEKIENFIDNLPKLKKTIEIDCKKCGFHHIIEVEGLEDFFD